MRKTLSIIIIANFLTFAAIGCRHVNSNNHKVIFAATITNAGTATDDFSIALKAANDGVEKLQTQEPVYYATIHPYLVNLAKLNDKAIATIRAAMAGDTAADWKGALVAVVNAASQIYPTVFGFKNSSTQPTVKILFATFSTDSTTIKSTF